jgi:hypothetical protein
MFTEFFCEFDICCSIVKLLLLLYIEDDNEAKAAFLNAISK